MATAVAIMATGYRPEISDLVRSEKIERKIKRKGSLSPKPVPADAPSPKRQNLVGAQRYESNTAAKELGECSLAGIWAARIK